jgi:hypothetical protein
MVLGLVDHPMCGVRLSVSHDEGTKLSLELIDIRSEHGFLRGLFLEVTKRV